MIRVAPLADLNKERELAIARRARASSSWRPSRRASSRCRTPRRQELQAARQGAALAARHLAVDERTNVLIARDVAGNLNQIEELIRALDTQTPQVLIEARIVEATSRYLRDIGIQWGGDATFSRPRATPRASRSRRRSASSAAADDQTTPTARPLALHQRRAEPELRRQPAGGGRHRVPRWRARPHVRLDQQHRQPGGAPLGGRVERHAPHRLEPARPHARQPRGTHRPGHAHPVLADQRAGRADVSSRRPSCSCS
jgi:hypothetical protein